MKALTIANILAALFFVYSVYLFLIGDNSQLQKLAGFNVAVLLLLIIMFYKSHKAKLILFERLYTKGTSWWQVCAKTTFFYTLRNKFQDLHGKTTNRINGIQPAGILILAHKGWIKDKYKDDPNVSGLIDDLVRKYILSILLLVIFIFYLLVS